MNTNSSILSESGARIPYALRRVPKLQFSTLLPLPHHLQAGDIALARLEKIGKNTRLELAEGRAAALHEGDLLAVVLGNRYATEQFEGYAQTDGDACDLLSMGGVCGMVKSRHAAVPQPSRLWLLGAFGDAEGRPLQLADFKLSGAVVVQPAKSPRLAVVCGSAMDAGKTHTALNLIMGLRASGHKVAGIKLTGTAAGRDTWNLLDAGAALALDFVDGGFPSTYLCTLEELLALADLLIGHALVEGVDCVVIEIADGLLQRETAALLQCPAFSSRINTWLFATGDPLGAVGGVSLLRSWGIEPVAISGLISLSPLGCHEAESATGIRCVTAEQLGRGKLNNQLMQTENGAHRPHVNTITQISLERGVAA